MSERPELLRALDLKDCIALIVCSVIGSGIFFAPAPIAELLPSPGAIYAVWIAGALLSLAGALTVAELGAMFPHAGGDYVYLRDGIHPFAGFVAGWLSFFGSYAGTIASLAAAFASIAAGPLGLGDPGRVMLAIALIVATSALNHAGIRWGALANNMSAVVKIAILLGFAIAAFSMDAPEVIATTGAAIEREYGPGTAFALALSPVLFSYLGWNASVYVAGEIEEPQRNLPRSLLAGLAVCTAVYVIMNAAYLHLVPIETLAESPDAGRAAASALLGEGAGRIVSGFVLLSILGTLSATVLVGPRIAYAMARDGLFLKTAGYVSPSFRTPAGAIWIQAVVSIALVAVLRSFPSALDFTTFSIMLVAIADVLALMRLRRTQPERHRPYRAFGYPVVPILYAIASLALALVLAAERPFEAGTGIALLVAGGPVYLWLRRRSAEH